MGSRQVLTRFEAERQALALMDHPNIAKVLDAGATDSGEAATTNALIRRTSKLAARDRQRAVHDEKKPVLPDSERKAPL